MRPPGSRLGKRAGVRGWDAAPSYPGVAQLIFVYFFQRVSASFLGAEKPPVWFAL